MKTLLRASQFCQVSKQIGGLSLAKYGVPYDGVLGSIYQKNVDFMLIAIERFPELHVVSYREDFSGVNCFIECASFYRLALGDANPEISFTSELLESDFPAGDAAEIQIIVDDFLSNGMDEDPITKAVMNWTINKASTSGK